MSIWWFCWLWLAELQLLELEDEIRAVILMSGYFRRPSRKNRWW